MCIVKVAILYSTEIFLVDGTEVVLLIHGQLTFSPLMWSSQTIPAFCSETSPSAWQTCAPRPGDPGSNFAWKIKIKK